MAEIPNAGAAVVRIAFRLGILVDEVSQNLQPRDVTATDAVSSWAYVLPDVAPEEVQNELDAFHDREVSEPENFTESIFFPGTNMTR